MYNPNHNMLLCAYVCLCLRKSICSPALSVFLPAEIGCQGLSFSLCLIDQEHKLHFQLSQHDYLRKKKNSKEAVERAVGPETFQNTPI